MACITCHGPKGVREQVEQKSQSVVITHAILVYLLAVISTPECLLKLRNRSNAEVLDILFSNRSCIPEHSIQLQSVYGFEGSLLSINMFFEIDERKDQDREGIGGCVD